jgi:uncharacterized protein (DUF58 family)
MAVAAARQRRSPVQVELADLIALRPVGEALKLPGSRVRVQGAGGHLSKFKGRGVEYDESRPYQVGDDLRTFDWRVTARTGKPHTKIYRDERNRPVLVWLDLGRSMHFATRGAYKSVIAAETAALIAWAAVANGDRLGGLVFSGDRHRELRPRLGRRAALALLSAAAEPAFHTDDADHASATATATAPDTASQALDRLTRVIRPGSLVFLLSDFHGLGADAERQLWQLRSHADLVLVHIHDPLEGELPPPGRYRIQQGARTLVIDTASRAARERYRERSEAHRERLRAAVRPSGMHLIECATTQSPASVLAAQFMRR